MVPHAVDMTIPNPVNAHPVPGFNEHELETKKLCNKLEIKSLSHLGIVYACHREAIPPAGARIVRVVAAAAHHVRAENA